MCGIAGFINLIESSYDRNPVIERMLSTIAHRGPDSSGIYSDAGVAIGFRRLSLIDLTGGDQPLYSEDRSVVLVCNGEIFNHIELRQELVLRGHQFSTKSDVEVLIHLYEEHGLSFVERLNGQFAFALFDRKERFLILGRDQAGIAPMFFARRGSGLVFGSEIKAMLPHPDIAAKVDLVGLDHVVCFPGVVSPRTMFDGVEALAPGTLLTWKDGESAIRKYWDFNFVRDDGGAVSAMSTKEYQDGLALRFENAVYRRLQADVPVGIYLSGGLDSSMIACMSAKLTGSKIPTFSVIFDERGISERKYQSLVARAIASEHHEILFSHRDLIDNLSAVIYHSECPVKETYNACSFLLSAFTKRSGIKAILTGEGADELFAGYPSYKFAALKSRSGTSVSLAEKSQREQLWGLNIAYEKAYAEHGASRMRLYSPQARDILAKKNAMTSRLVDPDYLEGRDSIHQRAYLDCKLRLSDHLLTEHGDRMLLANSVEGRFPFLDKDFVEFSQKIPSALKLSGFNEKYILKKVAAGFVPNEIVRREKYGFHAPGSPWLLQHGGEWIKDLLAPERLRRQGYFDPAYVASLLEIYSQPGFSLDARMEDDLLMIVISFCIFLDIFGLPDL